MSSWPMTTPASSVPTTLPRLNEPMRIRPMTKPTASVRKIASSGFSLSADTKNDISVPSSPAAWRMPPPRHAAAARPVAARRARAAAAAAAAARCRSRACAATPSDARPRVAVELVDRPAVHRADTRASLARAVSRGRTRARRRAAAGRGPVASLRAGLGTASLHLSPAGPRCSSCRSRRTSASCRPTSCRRCRRGRRRRRRGPCARPCCRPGPGVLREMASPPPLPCVTRVVVPVRLLVTRAVWAHWSPRCTEVEPQLP